MLLNASKQFSGHVEIGDEMEAEKEEVEENLT